MKKILAILATSALALGMLVGCGGAASSSTAAAGTAVDYTQVIEACRPSDADSIEIVSDTQQDQSGMLAFLGVTEDEMQKYAASVSLINTKAYAIVIISPKDGSEKTITDALDQFVVNQKAAFENYLPDQYEIANSAVVKTTSTGEVILVMCQDSSKVVSEIEKQLKAE